MIFSLLSDFIFPPNPRPIHQHPYSYESLLVEAQNEVGERILLEIESPPLHSYARRPFGTAQRQPIYDERTFYK